MAYGDTKAYRGGYGGSSYSYDYDDEGRGQSKEIYDQFVDWWEARSFRCEALFEELELKSLYQLAFNTTARYGVEDFCSIPGAYCNETHDRLQQIAAGDLGEMMRTGGDGRTRRLIEKKCDHDTWMRFFTEQVPKAYEHDKDERWKQQIANAIFQPIQRKRWDAENAKREAKVLEEIEEQYVALRQQFSLTAGELRNDFHDVMALKEKHDAMEGDWLDEPVDAYASMGGYSEETRQREGVKIQITCSLDVSNSMRHNNVSQEALDAFVHITLSLRELSQEYPKSVSYAAFTFSGGRDGKQARRIRSDRTWSNNSHNGVVVPDEYWLGEMEEFRNVSNYWLFDGEDTWINPLFETIERWENSEGDDTAVRLDLIISDAVLEHPTDVRTSTVIQDRRNGALQTVIINLMPKEYWHGGALPRRCLQYEGHAEDLTVMMKNLISEFVGRQA